MEWKEKENFDIVLKPYKLTTPKPHSLDDGSEKILSDEGVNGDAKPSSENLENHIMNLTKQANGLKLVNGRRFKAFGDEGKKRLKKSGG